MFKRYCKYECMTIQKDISVITIVETSWLFVMCVEWGVSVAWKKKTTPSDTQYEAMFSV
jgi:hypothetical protein